MEGMYGRMSVQLCRFGSVFRGGKDASPATMELSSKLERGRRYDCVLSGCLQHFRCFLVLAECKKSSWPAKPFFTGRSGHALDPRARL